MEAAPDAGARLDSAIDAHLVENVEQSALMSPFVLLLSRAVKRPAA